MSEFCDDYHELNGPSSLETRLGPQSQSWPGYKIGPVMCVCSCVKWQHGRRAVRLSVRSSACAPSPWSRNARSSVAGPTPVVSSATTKPATPTDEEDDEAVPSPFSLFGRSRWLLRSASPGQPRTQSGGLQSGEIRHTNRRGNRQPCQCRSQKSSWILRLPANCTSSSSSRLPHPKHTNAMTTTHPELHLSLTAQRETRPHRVSCLLVSPPLVFVCVCV